MAWLSRGHHRLGSDCRFSFCQDTQQWGHLGNESHMHKQEWHVLFIIIGISCQNNHSYYLLPNIGSPGGQTRNHRSASLIMRGKLCYLIIKLFLEDGSIPDVNQGTNYNVWLPIHLILIFSKQIKIGREIIHLENAS